MSQPVNTEIQNQLNVVMKSIVENNFVTYGTTIHSVHDVNIGSGLSLEIHYFEDSSEINEAFLKHHGHVITLNADEIESLSTQL